MVDIDPTPISSLKLIAAAAAALALVGCGPAADSASVTNPVGNGALRLRLGYFPNLTHAPALAGVTKGYFAGALGSDVTLETQIFNAGPEAVTAILSGAIDAAFVGPNPTTNAFAQSHGRAVRVIAGSTSGGALLVVKPSIKSTAGLKGKKIADPQLGGTQDVALRWFLRSNGLRTDPAGGGDVNILPQDNSQTLSAFKQGQIDGAWLPEPWATRLILEAGAIVLVDERDLWPLGRFVTTNLIVSTTFLRAHPKRIKALLEGLYQSIAYLNTNPADAQKVANDAVAEMTGKKLASGVVAGAWPNMSFTIDPLAATLKVSADHAHSVGLLGSVDLHGLYDLTLLNQVLAEHDLPAVSAL